MLPIFVFIALPTLSLTLLFVILCRKFATFVLHPHLANESPRRAMSRLEALQLLGLGYEADPRTIRAAYKRLMIQYHPDHGGSHQTAARLNLARDTLLRVKKNRAA
jgi:preprotein translocase subunit Sec63